MSISTLDDNTGHSLRSLTILPSICQTIEEVVLNSLDAGASSVDVTFDLKEWAFSVTDNGRGMTEEDLQLIGDRYGEFALDNPHLNEIATSKCTDLHGLHNVQTFGFRGEALSSIAQTSRLEILTRHLNSNVSFRKIIMVIDPVFVFFSSRTGNQDGRRENVICFSNTRNNKFDLSALTMKLTTCSSSQ